MTPAAYIAALEDYAQDGDTLAMLALADEVEGTPLAKAYRWMAREGKRPIRVIPPTSVGEWFWRRRDWWLPSQVIIQDSYCLLPDAMHRVLPKPSFLGDYDPPGKGFHTWHGAVAALAVVLPD